MTSAVLLTYKQWIHVSRCRAKCLSDFVQAPLTDDKCTQNKDCDLCWRLCERQTVTEWKSLCTPSTDQICPPGCRTACTFTDTTSLGAFTLGPAGGTR